MAELFPPWKDAFLQHVQQPSVAAPLKAAATSGHLTDWTTCLTGAVVRSCEALGWRAAGKGHPLDLLPQAGQEYLGIDVMAFAPASGGHWPFPLAAFELENSKADDRVAYSLWKVLCLRTRLRVVFAYRPDWEQGRKLVHAIGDDVVGTIPPGDRAALAGETVLVVGNRGEGDTFPWGYFKFWVLNTNVGRFAKVE
ncbi:hypothetical protein R5W23_004502 [Gemmata sp. JC673]|uniref:Uncharacterized protein n=1 Tax=Gemmata algarum TaxID=2975278 RepID=A0ABU5F695_9BACT|nr:hypothetical protein [Gemmata algarum]MDY3563019.1 hypothetical protein [Gemmata algarum]